MYEAARAEARRHGISFAELVRRALIEVVPTGAGQPWMELAGTLEAELPDVP